jgi:transcriptional regulator with XRE-family HTH domain
MAARETWFKKRVTTRLSWLGVSQADFAKVICLDKATLSREMSSGVPRDAVLERIALGLGVDSSDLLNRRKRSFLLSDHPALKSEVSRAERVGLLCQWYQDHSSGLSVSSRYRRTDQERLQRRLAVKRLVDEDRFCPESVHELAERFRVSSSQIYADRTVLLSIDQQNEGSTSG